MRSRVVITIVLAPALAAAACTSSSSHASRSSTATTSVPHGSVGWSVVSSPPSPAPPARRSVTILGSGVVLIHPPLWEQAHADALAEGKQGYDFGPMYASIRP